MIIRKGTVEDCDTAGYLYDLARKGMKDRGIDQWQGDYPNKDTFLRDVSNNAAYAAEEDGKVIGVAAIILGKDKTYEEIDGKWETEESVYGVVHRITVDPDKRGAGIAGKFFAYAEDMCRNAGIKSMRCDTHKDNIPMQHTLKKFGFSYCGIIICDDGTERIAFEKTLSLM